MFGIKLALQAAHTQAQTLRNMLDIGPAHGHQQINSFAHLVHQRVGFDAWQKLQKPAGIFSHGRHGGGTRCIQIAGIEHKAIEFTAKFKTAIKKAPVQCQIVGRGMGEIDAVGSPAVGQ
ncbi:hypothetical protein GCM10027395_12830 [Giesbergeria sinuosa]